MWGQCFLCNLVDTNWWSRKYIKYNFKIAEVYGEALAKGICMQDKIVLTQLTWEMITDHNILLFILCSCIGFRNYEIDLFDVEFSSFFIFFPPKLQDSFITSDAMIFLFWQPIYRDFVFSYYEIERFFLWIHDFLKRRSRNRI